MKTRLTYSILLATLILCRLDLKAQSTFDPKEGCLNVINVSSGPGIGEYGDRIFSVTYQHELLINEQFSFGGGLGYSYHNKYKLAALPVFLSASYFFMDKPFTPYANMRVGFFGELKKGNVGTNELYSVSKNGSDLSLYFSPSVGVKMHLSPKVGVMVSLSNDFYLLNVYDTKKQAYNNKLISNLGINLSVCFQIPGW